METVKLTAKQENALIDAFRNNGRIFTTDYKNHSAQVLRKLERMGLLKQAPNWTIWILTDDGREALKDVY